MKWDASCAAETISVPIPRRGSNTAATTETSPLLRSVALHEGDRSTAAQRPLNTAASPPSLSSSDSLSGSATANTPPMSSWSSSPSSSSQPSSHANGTPDLSLTSLSAFLTVFRQSCARQSWISWAIAMTFHLFHTSIIVVFFASPLLMWSTTFSSQTMSKPLLVAHGIVKDRRSDAVGEEALSTSVSRAPVVVENIWAIHDDVFFLEPGHVVMPTTISNSFGRLVPKGKKTKESHGGVSTEGLGTGKTQGVGGEVEEKAGEQGITTVGTSAEDGTHAYVVPTTSKEGGGKATSTAKNLNRKKNDETASAVSRLVDTGVLQHSGAAASPDHLKSNDVSSVSVAMADFLISPPPVPLGHRLAQRKSPTSGHASISKIVAAWEASPLYSSPLSLTLFYYLYGIGCIILLVATTEGRLTGHFSLLRLVICMGELLWYLHHGAHAFIIMVWLIFLSHWPHQSNLFPADAPYLHRGTPYAMVRKTTGEVQMYWYYYGKVPSSDSSANAGTVQLLLNEMDMKYYLYDQVWYIGPIAKIIAGIFLALLAVCIVKDIQRVLDALVGVRSLVEPEGYVRCPLCGELMELREDHPSLPRRSGSQSARRNTMSSLQSTLWWWAWLRITVLGSRRKANIIHFTRPVWRWWMPCCCAPPLPLTSSPGVTAASTTAEAHCDAAVSRDIERALQFYNNADDGRHGHAEVPSSGIKGATANDEMGRLLDWLVESPTGGNASVPVNFPENSDDSNSLSESAVTSSDDDAVGGIVRVVHHPTASSLPHRGAAPTVAKNLATGMKVQPPSTLSATPFAPSSAEQHQEMPMTAQTEAAMRAWRRQKERGPTEEMMYWSYATRHVHHRCPKLYLDAPSAMDDDAEMSSIAESAEAESSSSSSSGTSAEAEDMRRLNVPSESDGVRNSATATATRPSRRAHSARLTSRRKSNSQLTPQRSSRANPADGAGNGGTARGSSSRSSGTVEGYSGASSARKRKNDKSSSGGSIPHEVPTVPNVRQTPDYGTMRQSYPGVVTPKLSGQDFVRPVTAPAPVATSHIIQRPVYDPVKKGNDEFRPGNAFPAYDSVTWISRVTFSWLNPLMSFGLLEPSLLRQERFLPSLPDSWLSLDNTAVPAWRLWVHRRVWFASYIAQPGELLIPSKEAIDRAEEAVLSLADMHEVSQTDEEDEEGDSQVSDDKQTVVMIGNANLKQAAKLRPHRPRRSVREQCFWFFSAPMRFLLVTLFYQLYIGTSRTVRRTRRRLVRELLKDRLTATSASLEESYYDGDHYMGEEGDGTVEEATWALAEIASSCGSSLATPSAGSALPSHMRRQLALRDVSLYHLFLEHRCGRRFLFCAAPLGLAREVMILLVVPMVALFVDELNEVSAGAAPTNRARWHTMDSTTAALLLAAGLGMLVVVQGLLQSSYFTQVHEVAMEAETCIRAMVFEKTLALPLAQRTFSEQEVVNLVTAEAACCATCLRSLHRTWCTPLRILLLLLLLSYYLSWAAAGTALCGVVLTIPLLRSQAHLARHCAHDAKDAAEPRLSYIAEALALIRQVKSLMLEGYYAVQIEKVRAVEAVAAERAALAEGTAALTVNGLILGTIVASLAVHYAVAGVPLSKPEMLIPAFCCFALMTTPLMELPPLFTCVARGFLSMKRVEAYIRQIPDEFVGTWVDLPSFMTLQETLRVENPSSSLLNYRRGSVVCQNSSYTWQHDMTEEAPEALLRDVSLCIQPGEFVVVQGSMGSGKSTLLLAILGEVNRCVNVERSDEEISDNGYDEDAYPESELSVASLTDAAAVFMPPQGTRGRRRSGSTARPRRGSGSPGAASPMQGHTLASDAVSPFFIASPTQGGSVPWGVSNSSPTPTATVASSPSEAVPDLGNRDSAGDGAEEFNTGGFLVFGSCAYCAESPWLQNDTIRSNITCDGSSDIVSRWYTTVLRACCLEEDLDALPNGDETVVGERGETLSLSLRCRIALARAVYSKAHIYLLDGVLSPLDQPTRQHIIREVLHRLLIKRTVILASNVGVSSLRPHRVFTVVDSGVVREDTALYKPVNSIDERSDASGTSGDSEGETQAPENLTGMAPESSAALPPLYAEEFEESSAVRGSEEVAVAMAIATAESATHMLEVCDNTIDELHAHVSEVAAESYSCNSPMQDRFGRSLIRRSVHFSTSPAILQNSSSGAPSELMLSPALVAVEPAAESCAFAAYTGNTEEEQAPLDTTIVHVESDPIGSVATSTSPASAERIGEGSLGQQAAAQRLQQQHERSLRRRHRLSFYIFIRFMGSQVLWLLFTAFLQQLAVLAVSVWAALWLTAVASTSKEMSTHHPLWQWIPRAMAVSDLAFVQYLAVICAVATLLVLVQVRAIFISVYGTVHVLYNHLLRRILSAPASYFDGRIVGLLMRVLRDDAAVAEHQMPSTLHTLLSCAMQLLVVLLWCTTVNPLFILVLPIVISLFQRVAQRHAVVLREVRRLEVGSIQGMVEILRELHQGASTVRCMVLQNRLREEFCCSLDTITSATMIAFMGDGWAEFRLHVIMALSVAATAMLGVLFTFPSACPSLTAVAVVVTLRAGPELMRLCRQLGVFGTVQWSCVQRLMSLWVVPQEPLTAVGGATLQSYPHALTKARTASAPPSSSSSSETVPLVTQYHSVTASSLLPSWRVAGQRCPHLELRSVSARYRSILPCILHDVNLAVYRRERLGVVGHAGQGKSSLFNVLLRLTDVVEGSSILVDGVDTAEVPFPILRSWFHLVPQEPLVMEGTWRTNLLLGYHPEHLGLSSSKGLTGQASESMFSVDQESSTSPLPVLIHGESRSNGGFSGEEEAESAYYSSTIQGSSVDTMAPHPLCQRRFASGPGEDSSGGERPSGRRGIAGGFTTLLRMMGRHGGGQTASQVAAVSQSSGSHMRFRLRRHSQSSRDSYRASEAEVQRSKSSSGDAALWAALRAVGLASTVESAGGLDAPLAGSDWTDWSLSDSRGRLLCLARAVLNRPPFLLLEDSVHSGTDAQTDRVIRDVVETELSGCTVIVIAHRLSTVLSLCTRVVAMEQGTLLPVADLYPTKSDARSKRSSASHLSTVDGDASASVDPQVIRLLSSYLE